MQGWGGRDAVPVRSAELKYAFCLLPLSPPRFYTPASLYNSLNSFSSCPRRAQTSVRAKRLTAAACPLRLRRHSTRPSGGSLIPTSNSPCRHDSLPYPLSSGRSSQPVPRPHAGARRTPRNSRDRSQLSGERSKHRVTDANLFTLHPRHCPPLFIRYIETPQSTQAFLTLH